MAHTSSNCCSWAVVASGSEEILCTAVRRFINTTQPARASHQMLKYAWMPIISARMAPPIGIISKCKRGIKQYKPDISCGSGNTGNMGEIVQGMGIVALGVVVTYARGTRAVRVVVSIIVVWWF